MSNADLLYALFGVSSTCSDEELRKAYRTHLFMHHPDRNPLDVAGATARTHQLIIAYMELREQRRPSTRRVGPDAPPWYSVRVVFDKSENSSFVEQIAARKRDFQAAWNSFREHPRDVLYALRFIHAAIEVERLDAVADLLGNRILIDAAALLLDLIDPVTAAQTLLRWSDHLWGQQRRSEACAILEDGLATDKQADVFKDKLRSRYYAMTKGDEGPRSQKPDPDVRIHYLMRILDLGFPLGYIHKFLAEAYLDKGEKDTARRHLEQAFALDPELFGAAKISAALGINRSQGHQPQVVAQRRWPNDARRIGGVSKKAPVAPLSQVREWIARGNWNSVCALAMRSDYGGKDRMTMRLAAIALGTCQGAQTQEALLALARSVYSDVSHAAYASLAVVGDLSSLKALHEFLANDQQHSGPRVWVEYLDCRLRAQFVTGGNDTPLDAMTAGQQALSHGQYGRARFWLERALSSMSESKASPHQVVPAEQQPETRFLLAQACAKMDDPGRAIHIMLPILDPNVAKMEVNLRRTLTDWLWNYLVFSVYDPVNDDLYILALRIHAEAALTTTVASDFIHWIRYLTRWLEHVGAEKLILWIRHQMRDAAPGYSELDRGMVYSHIAGDTPRSEQLLSALSSLEERIRRHLPTRLQVIFGGTKPIKGRMPLVED